MCTKCDGTVASALALATGRAERTDFNAKPQIRKAAKYRKDRRDYNGSRIFMQFCAISCGHRQKALPRRAKKFLPPRPGEKRVQRTTEPCLQGFYACFRYNKRYNGRVQNAKCEIPSAEPQSSDPVLEVSVSMGRSVRKCSNQSESDRHGTWCVVLEGKVIDLLRQPLPTKALCRAEACRGRGGGRGAGGGRGLWGGFGVPAP
jgi:hypothetical protein